MLNYYLIPQQLYSQSQYEPYGDLVAHPVDGGLARALRVGRLKAERHSQLSQATT